MQWIRTISFPIKLQALTRPTMNITLTFLRLSSQTQLGFLRLSEELPLYLCGSIDTFEAVDDVIKYSAISVTLVGLLTFLCCRSKKKSRPVKKYEAVACHVERTTTFVNLFEAGTSMATKIDPMEGLTRLVSYKLAGKIVLTVVVGDLTCFESHLSCPKAAILKASGGGDFSQLQVNCDFQAGATDDCKRGSFISDTDFKILLGSAYSSALDMAKKEKLKQVAFPMFSINEEFTGRRSEKDLVAVGVEALLEWAKTTAEGGYHLTDVVWVAEEEEAGWTMVMAAQDMLRGSVKATMVGSVNLH